MAHGLMYGWPNDLIMAHFCNYGYAINYGLVMMLWMMPFSDVRNNVI